MNKISIHEIATLRKKTGLGITACKKALIEVNGNMNQAIQLLMKQGQKFTNIQLDTKEETQYGIVLAETNHKYNIGVIIMLTCQTDFVAKNPIFIDFAKKILKISLLCNNKDEILNYKLDKIIIKQQIIYYMNLLGENITLKFFKKISTPFVSYYIHHDNQIASLVGFSQYYQNIELIGKNIAMQIVGTNPKYIDHQDYRKNNDILENKLNQNILNKILLDQAYIKDTKISVKEYINKFHTDLKILNFIRISIKNIN